MLERGQNNFVFKALFSVCGSKDLCSEWRKKIQTIKNVKNYEIIINAMQKVIHSSYKGHTGWRFGSSDYSVAAKTGTAELYHHKNRLDKKIPRKLQDHAWFIGFAPVKNPKIAIAIIVEHSPSAVTIARRILDGYFYAVNQKD